MELNVTDSQRKIIKMALKQRVEEIEKTLSELPLFKELKEVQLLLKDIEGQGVSNEKHKEAPYFIDKDVKSIVLYNTKWSSVRKAEYILKEFGRGMTTKEISNAIMKREPNTDRVNLVSTLSVGLGTKSKEKKVFFRKLNELNEFVYYLMEWEQTEEAPFGKELL